MPSLIKKKNYKKKKNDRQKKKKKKKNPTNYNKLKDNERGNRISSKYRNENGKTRDDVIFCPESKADQRIVDFKIQQNSFPK